MIEYTRHGSGGIVHSKKRTKTENRNRQRQEKVNGYICGWKIVNMWGITVF